jgi:flavodoxin
MKIGIIVHSKTGNTYSVAEKLQEAISASGHDVSLLKVSAINDDEQDINKIRLDSMPDVSQYDALIFGAPVWAFSLSIVMRAYLSRIDSLSGKKAGCFVTQGLPFPWMGGKRSIRQFTEFCERKGAEVYATGIVNWPKREKLIPLVADKLSKVV